MFRRLCLWLIGALLLTAGLGLIYTRAIEPTLYPPTPTPMLVPTPVTLPHLPAFVPSSPCALENAEVHDDVSCYNERVAETEVANDGSSVLILRQEHVGSGCFGSISSDTQSLRLCDRRAGASYTTLLDHVIGEPLPSPDGRWFAVTTFRFGSDADPTSTAANPSIYKVSADGHTVTRLSAHGFPHGTAGAYPTEWEAKGDWLRVKLWDGSTTWREARLKADGTGVMGPLPDAATSEATDPA